MTSELKIVTRPREDLDIIIGSGTNVLRLTDQQLELVAALISSCRLGQQGYSSAAYEILDLLEEEFGSDFVNDASDRVDLQVTIEDSMGVVVFSTKSGNFYPTLEI